MNLKISSDLKNDGKTVFGLFLLTPTDYHPKKKTLTDNTLVKVLVFS